MLKFNLLILVSLLLINVFAQNISKLWGENGELWDPDGRLPDFSYAGYHAGEDAIPDIPIVSNVKDFGAKGDGVTNDLQAFISAVAATENGAIFIPKGKYIIDGLLQIIKSHIVLRGEGDSIGGTELYFTKNLTKILGGTNNEPWRFGSGGLLWIGERNKSIIGDAISTIIGQVDRGSRIIQLQDASKLNAGDYITIQMNDPKDHSLTYYLHNYQVTESDFQTFPGISIQWPVQVKNVNGNEVELEQQLRFEIKQEWKPKVSRYVMVIEETGIENLRITTPDYLYKGHHQEIGFNGLCFYRAFNCWAKNISFQNTENAATFQATKFCEMSNLKIYGGVRTPIDDYNKGMHGHHGVSFYENSSDNLLTDFYVYDKYWHEVTVSNKSNGNVIRRGMGYDISMDHHKRAPFENLFTNLNVGIGVETWHSSGEEAMGPHTAARETFWNIKSIAWEKPSPPTWGNIQANIIPVNETLETPESEWYENIDNIEPQDLYVSQQIKRKGSSLAKNDLMPPFIFPKPGQYIGEIEVMILSLSPDEEIRYTTNGSEPDKDANIYEGPFVLDVRNAAYKVKAKVFYNDKSSNTESSYYELDNVLPKIASVEVMMSNQIKVIFSEPVDSLSVIDTDNYSLNNDIEIKSCTMVDLDAVTILMKSNFSDSLAYILSVNNIKDLAGNKVKDNSGFPFDYRTVTLVASSFEAANPPQNVIDKKLGTRWSAQGVGEWIKFDLGKTKTVDYIDIACFKGDERSTFFSFEVSNDNIEWEEVFDGNSSGTTLQLERYPFSPVEARYVKIVGKGNNSSNVTSILWNSITEISIHAISIVSTIDNLFKTALEIYPNPTNNNDLNIKLNNKISGFLKISIYNNQGHLMYSTQINETLPNDIFSIPNAVFPTKGIYFIAISNIRSTKAVKVVVN